MTVREGDSSLITRLKTQKGNIEVRRDFSKEGMTQVSYMKAFFNRISTILFNLRLFTLSNSTLQMAYSQTGLATKQYLTFNLFAIYFNTLELSLLTHHKQYIDGMFLKVTVRLLLSF